MSQNFLKHKLKRVGDNNEILTGQYNSLMDRINKLESEIDTSLKNKNKKNSNSNSNSNKDPNKNHKNYQKDPNKLINKRGKKLCVFKRCPLGSNEKNKILFGQIAIENDNKLCTFRQCPRKSTEIGTLGHGSDQRKLCGFDTCPVGSYQLGNYISKR
jgi:hypothetical protein